LYLGERSRAATTHTNLSAVRADGPVLWVAGDETATVERLVADDPGDPRRYDGETSFRLADLVPLPGVDADEEADIEGLARTGRSCGPSARTACAASGDGAVLADLVKLP
jgi:hypothetical protein